MPVSNEEILVSIVVVIDKSRCPTEIGIGELCGFCCSCCVCEEAVCVVMVEGIRLLRIIRDGQIEPTVVIPIAEGCAHTVFSDTVFAEGNPDHETDLFKSAVPSIVIK